MDRTVDAAGVGRALLAFARSGATGVLSLRSGPLAADVAIVDGRPCAIRMPSDDELLGDALLRDGALDVAAHRRALRTPRAASFGGRARSEPIGEWLVRTNAATRPAVANALRAQLRRRIRVLLTWRRPTMRFEHGNADVGVPHVLEPDTAASAVLGAMRELCIDEPTDVATRRLGKAPVALSPLGEAVVRDAPLWPDEAALVAPLRNGCTPELLLARASNSPRALRWLRAMQLLGAIAPVTASATTNATLVSKTRASRRGASPDELLGIDARADSLAARRALRKLTSALHPDTLGPDVPHALRVASTNVMIALARAEETLRARSRK